MIKYFDYMYELDRQSFRYINRYFDYKFLNSFFHKITHAGGATFTIVAVLIMTIIATDTVQNTAIASGISLMMSHIPVAIFKKIYPRKRPYLVLKNCRVTKKPLTDCSFPSGHTTAIFSIITPFILLNPVLASILFPIGFLVGISRIYLGLHYPSDIIAGGLLGLTTGIICFLLMGKYAQMLS
ncbi:phosphatase PAP2 family protein [Ornithinibacillus xuwenensis]|uniref:Phosphatase PAP2 family protein n=1 Tax=Ornithinibacillus xuwenensis TaxID=3144668 RepID=A0ABU9XG43_9BACI